MKLVFFLISFTFCSQLLAQNLVYEYQFKNENISFTEDCILQIEKNTIYFKSIPLIQSAQKLSVAMSSGGSISFSDINRQLKYSIVYNKKKKQFNKYESFLGAKIRVVIPKDQLSWTILNVTKKVNNNILTKATTTYGGRKWIAWFNKEIPIPYGPYFFSGLPGVIVNIYDSSKTHTFVLKGQTDQDFDKKYLLPKKEKSFQKLNLKEYVRFQKNALRNPYNFYQANSRMKLPNVSEEKKKAYNEKKRKEYHPIEISN